jgi:uncharacterized protein (TIGR03067 family)
VKKLLMLSAAAALLMGLDSFAPVRAAGGKDGAKDLEALQGKWKVVRFHFSGKDLPPDTMATISVTVEKDLLSILVKGKPLAEVTLKNIDPSKNPKQFDMFALSGTSKGKTDLALYKLDGNKFAMYTLVGAKSQEKRPTAYPTKETEDDFDFVEMERIALPKGGGPAARLEALPGERKVLVLTVDGPG